MRQNMRVMNLLLASLTLILVVAAKTPEHLRWGSPKAPNNFLRPSNDIGKSPLVKLPRDHYNQILNGPYRLPTAFRPIHYVVKLQPFINGNLTILGTADIEFEVLEEADNVTLNVDDMVIFNDTIKVASSDDPDGSSIEVTQVTYDDELEMLFVSLGEKLQIGTKYLFSVDFEANILDYAYGVFRASYVNEDGNTVYLALTQFEATGARKAFPSFDEPALKATFDIYLGHEEQMTALANMPLKAKTPMEGQQGWVWSHFESSVVMSSYLVAFVISDFATNSTTTSTGMPYGVWSRPELINTTQYALDKGPEVLVFYEEYLGNAYTLPKMDMVSTRNFGGAMENWGLIIYSEDAMLYDPAVDSELDKQYVMQVIAHETAHQWFGNLVTTAWWSNIWLNEGYAQYMEYVGADHTEPSWNILDRMVVDEVQYVLDVDCSDYQSHPIVNEVESPLEINYVFDVITYEKGASINRMMKNILTESTFVQGLSSYLRENQYSNTFQDDLFEHLTTAAHLDGTLPDDLTMKQIMDTWTLQAGYPIVTVNRTADGTSATVSQEYFRCSVAPPANRTWWIPLTYTNQETPDFERTQPTIFMSDSERETTVSSLPSQDKWVIFNIQETGYYRVNYDDNNWDLLLQQLDSDPEAIHPLNRAQIIDDYMDISRAGLLSYGNGLKMMLYLRKEKEFIPWAAALNNVDYLQIMLARTDGAQDFKRYLLDLILPLYDSMGFEDMRNKPQEEQYKQMLALAWVCDLGHKDCVEKSTSLYKTWMNEPENNRIISPNLRMMVYCTAIAEGTEEKWEFARHQYSLTKPSSEKQRLLDSMGCSKDPAVLSRYLETAFIQKEVTSDNLLKIFARVVKSSLEGRDVAWDFLMRHAGVITQQYHNAFTLGEMVAIASESFNREEERYQVEQFRSIFAEKLDSWSSALIEQAIHTVNKNIAWMDANYDVIVQWLHKYGYNNGV